MAVWLRLSGWVCFLLGAAVFFLSGGLYENPRNLIPWLGMFIALLGMILTSSSRLADHFRHMRELKERAAQHRQPPPSPPAAQG